MHEDGQNAPFGVKASQGTQQTLTKRTGCSEIGFPLCAAAFLALLSHGLAARQVGLTVPCAWCPWALHMQKADGELSPNVLHQSLSGHSACVSPGKNCPVLAYGQGCC